MSKMFTFMKMVITMVENCSPDMIPVAFDGKFDDLLNEIPPGIYRDHIVEIFNIGVGRIETNSKNGHNSGHMGSPMARILHAP